MNSRNELYAAGLGLLVSSPHVLAQFAAGKDYFSGEDPWMADLFASQKIALIRTGSPQIDYRFFSASPGPMAAYLSYVEFGLEVEDGGLVFRDGYDLYEWDPSSAEVRLPSPTGYCRVGVGWTRGPSHASMQLHVSSVRTEVVIPPFSVELLFKA
jgi:hypothetical protein